MFFSGSSWGSQGVSFSISVHFISSFRKHKIGCHEKDLCMITCLDFSNSVCYQNFSKNFSIKISSSSCIVPRFFKRKYTLFILFLDGVYIISYGFTFKQELEKRSPLKLEFLVLLSKFWIF